MIIPTIDSGLESMVRSELPLPVEVGDVSFDPPSGTWSAQLSRITVNLFLFGVGRSPQPARPAAERPGAGNTVQRRPQIPMLQLNYLITVWAGTVRDEHQLLGDVLTCFLYQQALEPRYLQSELSSGVQLAVAAHDNNRAKDVWSTVGGTIRPSFELIVTVATDALPFEDLAPRAERVRAMVGQLPASVADGGAGR